MSSSAASDDRPRPYLSIVMATHDDFHGVWFTVQAIRSFFADLLAETHAEIICVDTNPESKHGKEVRGFFQHYCNGGWDQRYNALKGDTVRGRYIPAGHLSGTAAPRDWAIREARGEVVICMDCHVIPQPGSLPSLVEYFRANPDSKDFIHGPLLMDNFKPLATHMKPVWGEDKMFGKWGDIPEIHAADGRANTSLAPFEIPMHGLGMFACRKVAWPGLNPNFRGFGGEEGYIHEKVREAGGRVICLPQMTWLHRFGRPDGITYRNTTDDRFANYFVGSTELGKGVETVLQQFAGKIQPASYGQIVMDVATAMRAG